MEGNILAGGLTGQAGQNTSAGVNALTNILATASTTVAAPSGSVTNVVSNTASTVNVASSTGFNSSGGEFTVTHNGTPYRLLYTGTGSGTLTGVTTPGAGEVVALSTADAVIGGNGSGVGTNATAYQLVDLRRDYFLGLNVTTAGTSTTVALGPTSAATAYTPISATALPTGLTTIKVPAGWYVKITTTSGVIVASAISI